MVRSLGYRQIYESCVQLVIRARRLDKTHQSVKLQRGKKKGKRRREGEKQKEKKIKRRKRVRSESRTAQGRST